MNIKFKLSVIALLGCFLVLTACNKDRPQVKNTPECNAAEAIIKQAKGDKIILDYYFDSKFSDANPQGATVKIGNNIDQSKEAQYKGTMHLLATCYFDVDTIAVVNSDGVRQANYNNTVVSEIKEMLDTATGENVE